MLEEERERENRESISSGKHIGQGCIVELGQFTVSAGCGFEVYFNILHRSGGCKVCQVQVDVC